MYKTPNIEFESHGLDVAGWTMNKLVWGTNWIKYRDIMMARYGLVLYKHFIFWHLTCFSVSAAAGLCVKFLFVKDFLNKTCYSLLPLHLDMNRAASGSSSIFLWKLQNNFISAPGQFWKLLQPCSCVKPKFKHW